MPNRIGINNASLIDGRYHVSRKLWAEDDQPFAIEIHQKQENRYSRPIRRLIFSQQSDKRTHDSGRQRQTNSKV
ncbi:MAG: hypothetical protein GY768_32685 [Planctomycetaceae bacterium]|nr:hypothetical protein [Planctomycetaceae bacterium]